MFITAVNLPSSETQKYGLDPVSMNRLGQLVILSGRNGSGKSRILNLINSTINSHPTKERIAQVKTDAPAYVKQLETLKTGLAKENKKKNLEVSMSTLQGIIDKNNFILNWNFINTSEQVENYSARQFVPQPHPLDNPLDLSRSRIRDYAKQIETVGVEALYERVLPKIQHLQDLQNEATHPNYSGTHIEKEKAISDYERLKQLIYVFLGTDLTRDAYGQAMIFGFPLGEAQLSNGQNILIQFCMALYSQETKLDDLILMMDEPENHLHPEAIIDLIERLRKINKKGQIWIATHSIPLIAHFGPDYIWFVDKGRVEYGGRIPEKVLTSLLGSEEEIEKVRDFLSLPFQYATSRHAFESLFSSDSVLTEANDPQSAQVRDALQKLSENDSLRVLDFGAGKGRTLGNIFDYEEGKNMFAEKVDYICFDEFAEDKENCLKMIERVYGNTDKKYYNTMTSLLTEHDKHSFDVVIMCNVLHEIKPTEWLKLFQKGGKISQLLKPTGRLILMEDTQMPTGEKAYLNGFIVMDTPEIRELFKIPANDIIVRSDNDGRLKCHNIPAKYLTNITDQTRVEALQMAATRTQDAILKIRTKVNPDYKDGKYHGFVTQQYANIQLSLAELQAGSGSSH